MIKKNNELSHAVESAFSTALLLTASETMAEAAVLHAIGIVDCDKVSSRSFQLEVIRAAIRGSVEFVDQPTLESLTVPIELRPVLLLESRARHSFVLRVLLGMTREACAQILGLGVEEVDDAVTGALEILPSLNAAPERELYFTLPNILSTSASLVLLGME